MSHTLMNSVAVASPARLIQTSVYRVVKLLFPLWCSLRSNPTQRHLAFPALHLASNSWLHFKQNGASIEKEVSLTWGQHSINQSKKVLFKHAISMNSSLSSLCVAQSINGHEEICRSQTFPPRNPLGTFSYWELYTKELILPSVLSSKGREGSMASLNN